MNLSITCRALLIWLSIWLCFNIGTAYADVAVPPLSARVTDLTGTLTAAQSAALESRLREFESQKGSQIAVLIVPTTEPETIEQYSMRVAETWKLGRKGVDDGVLILVAKDDRAIRMEVGYGLEGAIPDVVTKRIISDIMVPFFKQGDYYGGLQAGVDRTIRVIEGEPLPAPSQRDISWSGIEGFLPLVFLGVIVLGGILRAIFGQFIGASIVGGIVGLALWLIIDSFFLALIAGIIAFLFTLAAGSRMGRSGYGGWGGGSYGGGGGVFRGGGGGFGGGGASGRW